MGRKKGARPSKGSEPGEGTAADGTRQDGSGPPSATLLDPLTTGVVLACLVAGPSLWSLYRAGDVDLTTAALRCALVAAGCWVGVVLLNRLVASYRRQTDRELRIRRMVDALDEAVHEGLPLPPDHSPGPGQGPAAPGHTPGPGQGPAAGGASANPPSLGQPGEPG